MPGMILHLAGAWVSADPMLSSSKFKIIHCGPTLGSPHLHMTTQASRRLGM